MIRDIEYMFTNFVNRNAGITPRQAEHADAHLDIRRQDPDERRGKAKKGDGEEELFKDEDKASVSVSALHAFLKDFLKGMPEDEGNPKTDKPKEEVHIAGAMNSKAKQPRPSGQARQAHNAYTNAAKTGETRSSFSTSDTQKTASSLGITASEVRIIHILIEDLEALMERDQENLEIERSSSFLQSLVNAVEKTKRP